MTGRALRLLLSVALLCSLSVVAPVTAGAIVPTESQVSHRGRVTDPDVSGSTMVYAAWTSDWSNSEVVAVDLTTFSETTITATPYEDSDPHVDGDWVAWTSWPAGSNGDVHAYNLVTHEEVTVTAGTDRSEWIDVDGGRVFWEDDRNGDYEIYMYDLATHTETRLTNNPTDDRFVCADGDYVTFTRSNAPFGENGTLLNLNTTAETDMGVAYNWPRISGDNVVFAANWDGVGDYELHRYNISGATVSTLTFTSLPYADPSQFDLSGTKLAYMTTGWDLFVKDIVSGTEQGIAGAPGMQGSPDISGSTVVWVDSRNSGTTGNDIWANLADPNAADNTPPVTVTDLKSAYDGTATIGFSATDDDSGVLGIFYKLDGGGVTQLPSLPPTFTLKVSQPGTHTIEYWAKDKSLNEETHHNATFLVRAVDTTYVKVEGADRYFTAVDASKEAFPTGIPTADYQGYKTVVIATGSNWPDALGAAGLAGALGGPVLLVEPTVLPSVVASEVKRLGASRAIVVGGASAVGGGVMTALGGLAGVTKVERISGDDRFVTAAAVASRTVEALGSGYDGTAFVASGLDFPDALSAAPLSAKYGWPLYLCGTGGLSAATVAAMDTAKVTNALLLGGTRPVPSATEAALKTKYGSTKVKRLYGPDRYQTAIAIARHGVDSGKLRWDGVGIATGENYPDALSGGVLIGRTGSVILLTRSTALVTSTRDELKARRDLIGSVRYLGGDMAVSPAVRSAIAAILK